VDNKIKRRAQKKSCLSFTPVKINPTTFSGQKKKRGREKKWKKKKRGIEMRKTLLCRRNETERGHAKNMSTCPIVLFRDVYSQRQLT
jgi:hypothetical protein